MENPILVDESFFDEAFIYERLVSREWQIREISKSLKSTKVGKSIKNLFVFGPPGVGKTIVKVNAQRTFHKRFCLRELLE